MAPAGISYIHKASWRVRREKGVAGVLTLNKILYKARHPSKREGEVDS
jgi:hypothetical protein